MGMDIRLVRSREKDSEELAESEDCLACHDLGSSDVGSVCTLPTECTGELMEKRVDQLLEMSFFALYRRSGTVVTIQQMSQIK